MCDKCGLDHTVFGSKANTVCKRIQVRKQSGEAKAWDESLSNPKNWVKKQPKKKE